MTPIKCETAIKTERLRKGWNSETTKHTFKNESDAIDFFKSLPVCEFIGEWKKQEKNVVIVFNCSAD